MKFPIKWHHICTTVMVSSLFPFSNLSMHSQATLGSSSAAASSAYGGCSAPSQAGVHVCFPSSATPGTGVASPVQVIATGMGAGGPVKAMQVFIDGKKVAQSSGNLFDAPITVGMGTHRLTVVELDSTGSYTKSAPISISVQASTAGEACAPPSSAGVNVCTPQPNNCKTAAWTTVIAAGTASKDSTVSRMELWVNGTKLANFPGNRINTNIAYLRDFDKITIVAVDSNGDYSKSGPIVLQSC